MVFGNSPLIKTGARTDGKDKARRAAKFKRASRGGADLLEHGDKNLLRRIGTVKGRIIGIEGELTTRWI